jgi:uncharacterized SAM-binding protein YcdF (DUF218 family)
MFTGVKTGVMGETVGRMVSTWRAVVLLGFMAVFIYGLLWIGGGASS